MLYIFYLRQLFWLPIAGSGNRYWGDMFALFFNNVSFCFSFLFIAASSSSRSNHHPTGLSFEKLITVLDAAGGRFCLLSIDDNGVSIPVVDLLESTRSEHLDLLDMACIFSMVMTYLTGTCLISHFVLNSDVVWFTTQQFHHSQIFRYKDAKFTPGRFEWIHEHQSWYWPCQLPEDQRRLIRLDEDRNELAHAPFRTALYDSVVGTLRGDRNHRYPWVDDWLFLLGSSYRHPFLAAVYNMSLITSLIAAGFFSLHCSGVIWRYLFSQPKDPQNVNLIAMRSRFSDITRTSPQRTTNDDENSSSHALVMEQDVVAEHFPIGGQPLSSTSNSFFTDCSTSPFFTQDIGFMPVNNLDYMYNMVFGPNIILDNFLVVFLNNGGSYSKAAQVFGLIQDPHILVTLF